MLKKLLVLCVLVLFVAAFSVGCAAGAKPLQVSDVQSDPFAYQGEIVISGVTSAFSEVNPALFGVMDTEELLQCKNFNCGAFVLPVKYVGSSGLPQIGDEVKMTGTFTYDGENLVFMVSKFTVVRNILGQLG